MEFRYDVFLSHSSADKPEVEFLAGKLKAAGITPFLDKWNLIPGEPWQEALEEALDESRTCAVFIGPKGIGPWQNREMRSAIEDRTVIPVLLPGSPESYKTNLSRFLRQLTWVEFRDGLEDKDAFHRLISGIQGTAPGDGGGGEVPLISLRPHAYRSMAQAPEEFIDRREYEQVLRALCPEKGTVESGTSIGITTALRGAGGFGKTALAQKLCQDKRVQETYPDGILWTTMGEDIDANGRLSHIRDLIRWWTQEESPAFETAAAAGARLRELLASSRVLIVIDDVWSSADVTPFQGFRNGSALLITTRDSQTLPPDSKRIEVDAMASTEAVELLRSGLADGEEQEFHSLARRLGEWPLLLKIVNRQIRELVNEERRPIQNAFQEINEALHSEGFAAFDRDDPESRHAAVSRTILVSVQRLQEKERERYFQLTVFPDDIQIPLSVLEQLWGVRRSPTRKLCRRLHALSLLLEFNSESETVRLHDVVRQVLLEQKRDQLPGIHRQLLDAFRPSSGSWSDLPNEEKYLWRNLADHLLGADQKDELRRLLTDFSFLQAKLNATDVNALIADYQIFVGEERELRLIRDALRLSAHVLTQDRHQLAFQLFVRLVEQKGKGIGQLLDSSEARLLLRPRSGTLVSAGGPLIRTLEGHSGKVYAVAVVDGRRAISASNDGTLRVWDLETGETLRTFEGHSGWVTVVDSRWVFSGSSDETLRLWNLETGETLRTFEGYWFDAVALVDDRRAVSGSLDGTLRVWDLETGETLRALEGYSNWGDVVAVVDGHRVVSGSFDRTLRVWDLETGEIVKTLKGHSDCVDAVAVVDSRRVVSGSWDGTLRVWDLETVETIRTLEEHSGWVIAVAVVDRHRAVSGSSDGTVRVWDMEIGETLRILEGHSGAVNVVAVVDDCRAVSGSNDGTLRVWDLETGETLRILEGYSGGMALVDGHRAISRSNYGTVRIWDLETGETLRILEGRSDWGNTALVDSRRAASGSLDGTLRVWDMETGETLRNLEGHSDWVNAVAVVDSRRVVSGSSDGTLRLWDLETGETLRTLEGHSGGVKAVAVVDGRRAVSASDDWTLRVWDVETGETLTVVTLDAPVWAVAVSRDGRTVMAGDQVGKVHFLDWVQPG